MPKLYVLAGKDLGAVFDVEDKALIGRSKECDVRLTDGSIGRRHARLEREGSHWHLIDLGSANGLRTGDEKVERVVLMDLDEVVLGRVRLRFRDDKDPEKSTVDDSNLATATASSERAAADEFGRDESPGLELEDEIDLESLAPEPARAASPKPSRIPSPANKQRAELMRQDSPRGGFLTDALEDRPLWLSFLLFLFVLALTSGLAYGMFRLVVGMRAG